MIPQSARSFAQNQRGELRESDIAPQLTTGGGKPGEGYPAVRIEGPMAFRPTGGSQGVEAGPLSPALKVGSGVGIPSPPGVLTPALTASNDPSRSPQSAEVTRQVDAVRQETGTVRRLSPVECERLMSWPDGWTAVDGDATPDGRRYAACGDGVVSNVAEWIGRRILAVDREMAR